MQEPAGERARSSKTVEGRSVARIPAAAFVAAPLIVAAFAYLFDVVFGTASLVVGRSADYGVERFAVVTAGWCVLEAFFGAIIYVRRRRFMSLLALSLYLIAVIAAVLWSGSFLI